MLPQLFDNHLVTTFCMTFVTDNRMYLYLTCEPKLGPCVDMSGLFVNFVKNKPGEICGQQ